MRRTVKNNGIETALLIASCVLLVIFLAAAIGCGIYELIKL